MKAEILTQLKSEMHRLADEKKRIENDMLRIQRFVRESEADLTPQKKAPPQPRGVLVRKILEMLSEYQEAYLSPMEIAQLLLQSGYEHTLACPLNTRVANELVKMFQQGLVRRENRAYQITEGGLEMLK